MNRLRLSAAILAAFLLPLCRPQPSVNSNPVDLILFNGSFVTEDNTQPAAQAVAIRGDRIEAVGDNAKVEALAGPQTQRIDLGGKLAIPGFIEGHGHFMGLGNSRLHLNLTRAKNWEEMVSMVGASTRDIAAGAWISGRGWHQEKWEHVPSPAVEGLPTHASLDSISPNNPVYLTHASGHASMVNGMALKIAGITR